MAKNAKPRIVAVSGAASGALPGSGEEGRVRAQRIQDAMMAATEQAMKDGITDPAKILALKLKAREAARKA